MTFTEDDKTKALAIVSIFETSKPFCEYDACVVLNDGAGVSYGINQFTHRSGSLSMVIRRYLANGGQLGREIFQNALPLLAKRSVEAIEQLAGDAMFKRTLRTAALTKEMKVAQRSVAVDRYLRPAIEICERMRFATPLALTVIYDSITHGSWELISARVNGTVRTTSRGALAFEQSWITEYVRARHKWLTDIARLRVTNYRTKFFLSQIAIGNWDLNLPITVHGFRLADLGTEDAKTVRNSEVAIPEMEPETATEGPSVLDSAAEITASMAAKFDRAEGVISAVTTRRDAAKSLWTTVAGSVWQAAWGIVGFAIGLPRTIWIVVAIIAGTLMILYLYRQIMLGRIREIQKL